MPSVVASRESAPTALLGVDCFRGDLDAAAGAVLARARSGLGGYACFCNAHVLMSARSDTSLMDALNGAWTVFPDGAPVAWFMPRSSSHPTPHRIGGPDLMARTLELSHESGLRHAFYGSLPQTLSQLEEAVTTRHPGTEVAIAVAPPFGELDGRGVIDDLARIRDARVDIIWVGLGAPRQELFMARHRSEFGPAVALGVGAAFDFVAGVKTRAPFWMQRAGLEWAHRLGTEPRRLGRRYVLTNSQFIAAAGQDVLSRRFRS